MIYLEQQVCPNVIRLCQRLEKRYGKNPSTLWVEPVNATA